MFFKLLRSTIFLCFFTVISTSLFAQTITGTVLDSKTMEPLPGANIVQLKTTNGVSTNADGSFTLEMLKNKSSKIKVTFVGYKTQILATEKQKKPLIIRMEPKTIISNEVFVEALRADKASPMAFENINRSEIEQRNLGQDMVYLMSTTPSVTTTSDAGAGIGYTGIRIRGVDQGRINITVNGIPMNDAESHNVFWVNMPDLASSVENIQIQRGVGTSTNGAAAFGATINIQTSRMEREPYGEVNTGFGSFDTRKFNVMLGSGLMKNGWQFEGRLSKISSEGYIDRAFSDLKSFYLSAARHGDRSLLRADVFSGKEKTYQAWYGVPEHMLESGNRTYNPAGMEKPGEPYENQTDNYQQDHYQLHYSYRLSRNWNANVSFHYTYGRGYYEEYAADQVLSDYSINPIQLPDTTIRQSDLIRQLWLNNHFYGLVFSTNYAVDDRWSLTLGGGYNEYDGDHFGEVIWAQFAGNGSLNERYYDNNAFKTDFNTYFKAQYFITPKLSAYADAQIRQITYEFLGKDRQPTADNGQQIINVQQRDKLTFFNPKAGITYNSGPHRAYISFSVANKEPTRDEYVNSSPENRPLHETLYDWEAGYRASFEQFFGSANFYYMNYDNQLILTGEINDVGAYIRQNVADSYRAGIELQAGLQLFSNMEWSANATFSRNKIDEYTYFIDNYDTGIQEAITYRDTDIAFSPNFIGSSILSYSNDGLSAAFTTKYVSRQYLDNTQTHSRSLDPYLVNDLRFSYSWADSPLFERVEATLQINNIFNEMYESNGYTFGYISEGEQQFFNYYYPQAGRNFLLQLSFTF